MESESHADDVSGGNEVIVYGDSDDIRAGECHPSCRRCAGKNPQ